MGDSKPNKNTKICLAIFKVGEDSIPPNCIECRAKLTCKRLINFKNIRKNIFGII